MIRPAQADLWSASSDIRIGGRRIGLTVTILVGLAGFCVPRAHAAFNSGFAGTAAGQFLKLGADARGVAMGAAMTAAAEDATAVYWNPAGLAALTQRNVSMTHAVLYQSIFYDFLAYAHPLERMIDPKRRQLSPTALGTIGLGVLYLNAGSLSEVDNTGASTGSSFTPRDVALIAAWGGSIGELFDVGIAAKYIDSRIEAQARTGAADLGARLKLHVQDVPVTVTTNARNLGGRLKFRDQADPLPSSYHLGASTRINSNWLISAEEVFPSDGHLYSSVGGEAQMSADKGRVQGALRAGFTNRTSSGDLDGIAGISFGVGVGFSGFGFDYGWAPFGGLGDTHRVSLSYRF